MCNKINRTSSEHIGHGLYLYFLGLSTRNVAKALSFLHIVKRSHVAIWKWAQKYRPKRMSSKRKRVSGFIVDETAIRAGSEYIWLWVAIEPKDGQILALSISKETCLWQKGLLQAWLGFMEGIRFQRMVVEPGIRRPAGS
jgi:putative transposase